LDHEGLLDEESLSVVSKTQLEKMWLVERLPNFLDFFNRNDPDMQLTGFDIGCHYRLIKLSLEGN